MLGVGSAAPVSPGLAGSLVPSVLLVSSGLSVFSGVLGAAGFPSSAGSVDSVSTGSVISLRPVVVPSGRPTCSSEPTSQVWVTSSETSSVPSVCLPCTFQVKL